MELSNMEGIDNLSENSLSQNSDTESDIVKSNTSFDGIIENFPKMSLSPEQNKIKKLSNISQKFLCLKARFIRIQKELNSVSSILLRKRGKVISEQEYMDLYGLESYNSNKNWIKFWLPNDIERVMKLIQYSPERIDKLEISIKSQCEDNYDHLEKILLSLICTEIKHFWFDGFSEYCCIKNNDPENKFPSGFFKVTPTLPFFKELKAVTMRATLHITFWNLKLNSDEFSQIVSTGRQVKKLDFLQNKITTDYEFSLSNMEGSQIEELTINNRNVYKDLTLYTNNSKNIINAVLSWLNVELTFNN